jgi:hypothetical protein
MWRQIPWVANGLTLQAGLELLAAVALLAGGSEPDSRRPTTTYGLILLHVAPWCLLATGSLKAFAARRNRAFRGRGLGLVALWSGLPSSVVWMCAPSALALLLWGALVYRDVTSLLAFTLGERGYPPAEVIVAMKRLESSR